MSGSEVNDWEATRSDIYCRLHERLKAGSPSAIAVVTDVKGSAYRRPGAKLVVSGAERTGSITAGCLENPVADLASEAIENRASFTETYDLTDEDDDTWGMGLGCNGVIDVFIDPLDRSIQPALDANSHRQRRGKRHFPSTLIPLSTCLEHFVVYQVIITSTKRIG